MIYQMATSIKEGLLEISPNFTHFISSKIKCISVEEDVSLTANSSVWTHFFQLIIRGSVLI